jgi:hypothetical protein
MKKFSIYFAFLVLVCLSACSNDLVLNDVSKEIPIVYGFLSRSDTAQYIRIEKAFISNDKGAPELAKDPNQLYFNDISAEILDVQANKSYKLTRVDAEKEGFKRAAGTFAITPNYLYKIQTANIDLKENKTFRLIVKKNDGAVLTEVNTIVLPDMKYEEPQPRELNLATSSLITWTSIDYRPSKIYDVIYHINVEERVPTENTWTPVKGLDWVLVKGFLPSSSDLFPSLNRVSYRQKDVNAFYRFLAENLDKDKKVVRKLRGIDVEVLSAGDDLYQYLNVSSINSGITGTEVLPTYSNVKNGYGILSSRNRFISKDLGIGQRSLDSLLRGKFTKPLNFQ